MLEPQQLADLFEGAAVDTAYFDALVSAKHGAAARSYDTHPDRLISAAAARDASKPSTVPVTETVKALARFWSKAAQPGRTVYSEQRCSRPMALLCRAAEALRAVGVRHVVGWGDQDAAPALMAAVCGKAFFATLRCPTATVPEVRCVSALMSRTHDA